MKSRPVPPTSPASPCENTPIAPVKKRSRKQLIFVLLTLMVMGFLIIRLQESEIKGTTMASMAATDVTTKERGKQLAKEAQPPVKKESANPARAVKADIRWRKNLVGETVLEGTLTNTSKAFSIKDAVLVVTWLSKSNQQFATTNYPIATVLGAKTTVPYKLKVKAPGKYASLKITVESATALL